MSAQIPRHWNTQVMRTRIMAPRSFSKGYLQLSLPTCIVVMTPENEKVRSGIM
ncbi:hypothetical protein ACU4I5_27080 (plasmid) [Ensifer adhaerens]|nr:hypothetical protein [Ensifer sp. ENS01]